MLNKPADFPPAAAPVAPQKSRWHRMVWVALLVVGAGLALLFLSRSEPSSVERFAVPAGWLSSRFSFRDSLKQWMPAWARRAREWARLPRRAVMINTLFVALESWSAADVERLGLGAPAFTETNGVRVWLVSSNQVMATRRALGYGPGATALSSPSVYTVDGVPAMMMTGTPVSGALNMFSAQSVGWFEPRVRGERLDLKAILSCEGPKSADAAQDGGINSSSASASNATPPALAPITHPDPLSVRIQIRDGQGVLVLQERRAGIGGKPLAIWIQATPMAKK